MISIVIPFHNEKENLPILVDGLVNELEKIKEKYEIVLINDGSDDFNPQSVIRNSTNIKIFSHRKRLGKGQALKTGIENSTAETVVFMDGDLQDDPKDLKNLLHKLNKGFDLVNGIRANRHENSIVKTYSKIASWFLRTFLGSPFTDINCGFKIFDRKILKDFTFYGNNFRFFPLATFLNGYKVGEIPVTNNERKYGQTKFGKSKLVVGMIDTLTAVFLFKFSEKPLHFFGIFGGVIFFIGFLISFYLTIERLFFGILLVTRPLLWLGLLLMIIGIQIIMTGIIGELIVYLNKKSNK